MDSFIVKIKDDNNIIYLYWFGKADNKDEAKSFVLEEYKNKPKFIKVYDQKDILKIPKFKEEWIDFYF